MTDLPDDTPADRFDRYLAETARERPELVDKYDRMVGRKRREPLPLGRTPVLITVVVLVAVAGLVVYAVW